METLRVIVVYVYGPVVVIFLALWAVIITGMVIHTIAALIRWLKPS